MGSCSEATLGSLTTLDDNSPQRESQEKGRGLGQRTARSGTSLVHRHSHTNAREITMDTLGVTPPCRSRASITAHTGNTWRSQVKYLDLSKDFVYPSARCISVLTKVGSTRRN